MFSMAGLVAPGEWISSTDLPVSVDLTSLRQIIS
jgi:hypothetical protein